MRIDVYLEIVKEELFIPSRSLADHVVHTIVENNIQNLSMYDTIKILHRENPITKQSYLNIMCLKKRYYSAIFFSIVLDGDEVKEVLDGTFDDHAYCEYLIKQDTVTQEVSGQVVIIAPNPRVHLPECKYTQEAYDAVKDSGKTITVLFSNGQNSNPAYLDKLSPKLRELVIPASANNMIACIKTNPTLETILYLGDGYTTGISSYNSGIGIERLKTQFGDTNPDLSGVVFIARACTAFNDFGKYIVEDCGAKVFTAGITELLACPSNNLVPISIFQNMINTPKTYKECLDIALALPAVIASNEALSGYYPFMIGLHGMAGTGVPNLFPPSTGSVIKATTSPVSEGMAYEDNITIEIYDNYEETYGFLIISGANPYVSALDMGLNPDAFLATPLIPDGLTQLQDGGRYSKQLIAFICSKYSGRAIYPSYQFNNVKNFWGHDTPDDYNVGKITKLETEAVSNWWIEYYNK